MLGLCLEDIYVCRLKWASGHGIYSASPHLRSCVLTPVYLWISLLNMVTLWFLPPYSVYLNCTY